MEEALMGFRWGRPSVLVACLWPMRKRTQTTKTDRLRHRLLLNGLQSGYFR